MALMKRLAGFAAAWGLVAFSAQGVERPAKHVLEREEAEARSERVSDPRYTLHFDFKSSDAASFNGETTIHFKQKQDKAPLILDFTDGKIKKLVVNGKAVAKPDYNGFHLAIPSKLLRDGDNTVTVSYSHGFSTEGAGLYRFKDPVDGKVYIYTHFEPYDANRLFPGFDQPDLKATYKMTVKAPKDWQVITSTMEKSVKAAGSQKVWDFPESAKFSTYLVSLHAGHYTVWKKDFRIPLRLFARQSLAPHVDHEYWFDVTMKGFDYFEKYFDEPYPFKKYDHVIVPDFNAGAMENVAAVAFSERYIPRGEWTANKRRSLANTILHEQAHMWFGNLVTMKWWDDLWLNESFASYMAFKAMGEAIGRESNWRDFYTGLKTWAYWEDKLVTTHPITNAVPDTESAMASFDGITYGKGASVLKQLAYFIGEDKFRDGVRYYFDKYPYQNTRLKDFVGALAAKAGKDLESFSSSWLETAGLNTLTARFTCSGDELEELKLLQYPDDRFGGLRQHRTEVALLGKNEKNEIVIKDKFAVSYNGQETVIKEAEGKDCPLMVYPNAGDYDYVQVNLDPSSLQAAEENFMAVQDSLLRAMFWNAFWDMTREAKFPVQKFGDLFLEGVKTEQDYDLARTISEFAGDGLLYYLQQGDQVYYEKFTAALLKIYRERLNTSAPGSDFQKLWLDRYIYAARGDEAEKQLLTWLQGKDLPKGLTLDQDRRWTIIVKLSARGVAAVDRIRIAEAKKDKSHSGAKMNLAAQAVRPEAKTKTKWWGEIFGKKSKLSTPLKAMVASYLFPEEQQAMRQNFSQSFYRDFPRLVAEARDNIGIKVASPLAPLYCNKEGVVHLDKFLKVNKDLPYPIIKRLKVAKQEDERCERIKGLATSFQARAVK